MTTYNTYQEAKIANPECEIYQLERNGLFARCDHHKAELVRFIEFDSAGIKCNPADYCMTVEKFLAGGYRFVDGDALLDVFGGFIVVGSDYSVHGANIKLDTDDRRHILRAAALEEKELLSKIADVNVEHYKRPRTKVEYVKCNNLQDSLDKFESMSGFEFYLDGDGSGDRINSVRRLALAYGNNSLYRRIETPMTERDELLEALQSVWIIDGVDGQEQLEKIVDSGLFKLVNHDSNRLRNKIRSVAEWEMNTSNNHDWESVAESIYCAVDDLLKS